MYHYIKLCTVLLVDVVDTVGCGGRFVAAIAFGYINNLPLVHTLTIANDVGAATAMGSGSGLDGQEVTFLSKKAVNGSNNQLISFLCKRWFLRWDEMRLLQ
ncbi:hypothetical protein POM88_019288 [Heracleum sosnowskyi]|uniref:Uncharacterized protein n=1 Tax=Heracleum sosnowskyi TaxID=360622 RepID=A0AAD8MVH6_9APIA|nr:hypothetical protein POM88_019288 [Heracleum sosnowskyi]